MSIKKQIEKNKFVIKTIINNYFVTHQKITLLVPLLEDKELFGVWNNTIGQNAVEALRMALYMAVLSDMRAILFDLDKRTASLEQVINALHDKRFLMEVQNNFIQPPASKVIGHDDDMEIQALISNSGKDSYMQSANAQFQKILNETLNAFASLKSSELAERVNKARSKIISHKEIKTVNGERSLYNPEDFGLKWTDAKDIVENAKNIIFNVNLLINCSSYDLDDFLTSHQLSADSFWSVPKKMKAIP